MSEFKRYDLGELENWEGEQPRLEPGIVESEDGIYMLVSDAQSELAALREELTLLTRTTEALINAKGDALLRLTAAEQRNAILEAGLRDVILKCRESWTQTAIEMFAEEALETALKPTESGASE